MVLSDHSQLEKLSSTAPMLEEKPHLILAPSSGGMGKILIREDTLLGGLACASCGKPSLKCGESTKLNTLCWGRLTDRKYTCMFLTLSATFLASLVGTIFFCFTNFLNNAIVSNMVLANNSMAYKMWQKPSVEPLMKIHLFNYTNIPQVMSRQDKLRVADVGPFVYAQTVERINTKFNIDGTLTFQEKTSFTFLPELSAGLTQFDRVVVPNIPLLSTIHSAAAIAGMQYPLNLGLMLLQKHKTAFIELPAHRFLWGYDDEIINAAKPILKWRGEMPFEQFGLLAMKNGTLPQKYTINTGEKDIDRLNFIERIDGRTSLSHWGTPFCNSLEATDGSMFPVSLLDKSKTLYVYKDNLCRRIPFVYQKDVEALDGILAYRYVIPTDVFDDPNHNRDNQCYCDIDSGVCPLRGLVNVSACAFGTPTMASFPHFYLGDQKLIDDIDGLHPDPHKHSSYIDLHPTLGIPLNVSTAFQVNVQVPKTDVEFDQLKFLKPGTVLPIAWIEATIGTIPPNVRTLVYHGTYSTAAAQLALKWGCGSLLLLSALALALLVRARRNRPCLTLRLGKDNTLNTQYAL